MNQGEWMHMARENTFFPECIEKLIAFSSKNKTLIMAIIGYGLCRCASGLPFWMLSSSGMSTVNDAGKIAGMLALIIAAYAFDREHSRFWVLIAPGSLALCGCCILAVAYANPLVPGRLGVFLFGFGTASMMLQWLEFISCVSLKQIALAIGSAEILSSIMLVSIHETGFASLACPPFLVAVSLFLLLWFRRTCDAHLSPSLSYARRSLASPKRLVSLRLVVWVSVYCFSYGLVNSLIGVSMLSASDNLGNMLPGIAIMLIAILLPDKFDIRALKSIAFIFMVSGILLLGALDSGNVFTQLFASAGAASCRLFAYSLACMRARMCRTSALPACALVKCLIIAMMLAGSYVGTLNMAFDRTFLVAGIILVVSVLSVCLSPFNVDERHVLDEATCTPSATKRAELISEVASAKKLSKREATIFTFMADGYDIAAISAELFISKSAVRAHASRIYAKFGVHNRQEFDDLVKPSLLREDTGE